MKSKSCLIVNVNRIIYADLLHKIIERFYCLFSIYLSPLKFIHIRIQHADSISLRIHCMPTSTTHGFQLHFQIFIQVFHIIRMCPGYRINKESRVVYPRVSIMWADGKIGEFRGVSSDVYIHRIFV